MYAILIYLAYRIINMLIFRSHYNAISYKQVFSLMFCSCQRCDSKYVVIGNPRQSKLTRLLTVIAVWIYFSVSERNVNICLLNIVILCYIFKSSTMGGNNKKWEVLVMWIAMWQLL